MARRIAALVLVVAATTVPPHALAVTSGVPTIEAVPDAISQLLSDYSRAWRTHDATLLARTVTGGLTASEAKALQNASTVNFSAFELRATTLFSGNLASQRVNNEYPGREVRTYEIRESSRIADESGTFVDDGAFTFTRPAKPAGGTRAPKDTGPYGGWRIASKDDLDVLGFFSPHHLWDEQPVTVMSSAHFTVLTHPSVAASVRPVASVAEEALARAMAFWPHPVAQHFVIVVPSTTPELGRVIHETLDLDKFVAFVANDSDREHGWVPTGPRLFVNLPHLTVYGHAQEVGILAHELTHAITRPVSGPNFPVFVEEGLANVSGGLPANLAAARSQATDAFPTNERFYTGPVGNIQATYDQATVAMQVLVDKFGRDGVARFYETLGAARVVPGTDEYHVEQALAQALHWSVGEWTSEWRKRLK